MAQETKNGDHAEDDEPFEVEFTPPSFVLKAKAPPTSRKLSEAIEEADTAVAALGTNYPQRAGEKVSNLYRLLEAMPAAGSARESIDALYSIAHEIRGEGTSFGFPLATSIATGLCAVLEDQDQASEALREAIRLHIDSLNLVVSVPIEGDGGEQGAELLDGLQKVLSAKGFNTS